MDMLNYILKSHDLSDNHQHRKIAKHIRGNLPVISVVIPKTFDISEQTTDISGKTLPCFYSFI